MLSHSLDTSQLLADSALSPQQALEQEEHRAEIQKAVDALSEKNRIATLLSMTSSLASEKSPAG